MTNNQTDNRSVAQLAENLSDDELCELGEHLSDDQISYLLDSVSRGVIVDEALNYERAVGRRIDGDDLGEVLIESVNTFLSSDDLQDEVQRGHAYLQNELFFNVVQPIIQGIANSIYTDQRNKAARDDCKKMVEALNLEQTQPITSDP